MGAPDFPVIASMQDQLREYYSRKIIDQIPSMVDDLDLQFGNVHEKFIRMVNEGNLKDISEIDLPNRLSQSALDARYVNNTDLGWINVKDYGAKGDSVTDDTAAIKAAFDAVNLLGSGTVYFPDGTYKCATWSTFTSTGSSTFPRYCFKVGSNINIIGSPGSKLIYSVDYDTRRVMFYLEGSSIDIEGLTIVDTYDMAGGSRPTGIPIACGNAFEPASTTDCNDITIRNCVFSRPWYPTKFHFEGTVKASNLEVSGCISYGEIASTSSGGYNFRSYPGGISDVTVTKNRCYNVTVSAAVGFYGTYRATANNNILVGSQIDGGGVQCENGAFNVSIVNNILINHYNHAWVDDSAKVVVANNIMYNTTVDSQFKAVRITKQGYTEDANKLVTGVVVNGNLATNCFFVAEAFGTPVGTPTFGSFRIADNYIELDGVTNSYNINLLGSTSCTLVNNILIGASAFNIRIAPNSNQYITIDTNTTLKAAAEASVGCTFTNTNAFRPIVSNNRFTNGDSFPQAVCMMVGSTHVWTGTGTPESAVSSPVGSQYLRKDGTAGTCLYIKESGTGSTGWVAK